MTTRDYDDREEFEDDPEGMYSDPFEPEERPLSEADLLDMQTEGPSAADESNRRQFDIRGMMSLDHESLSGIGRSARSFSADAKSTAERFAGKAKPFVGAVRKKGGRIAGVARSTFAPTHEEKMQSLREKVDAEREKAYLDMELAKQKLDLGELQFSRQQLKSDYLTPQQLNEAFNREMRTFASLRGSGAMDKMEQFAVLQFREEAEDIGVSPELMESVIEFRKRLTKRAGLGTGRGTQRAVSRGLGSAAEAAGSIGEFVGRGVSQRARRRQGVIPDDSFRERAPSKSAAGNIFDPAGGREMFLGKGRTSLKGMLGV